MGKVKAKTVPTGASVEKFIRSVPDPVRRSDAEALAAIFTETVREPAVMWGPSIIGFGTYPLRYADGSTADWPVAAFSPRKKDLTVYLMGVFESHPELMKKLGKHRTGKVCLYLRRLEDVDAKVLRQLVVASVRHVRKKYR